jgi:16S rRNA (cytidine1402-2'-O)-methyltransferase
VSRELTKLFEETVTAPLAELAAEFAGRSAIKGEIVLVVQGLKEERIKEDRYKEDHRAE